MQNNFGFDKEEIPVLKRLNTPAKIQAFIDFELKYNLEEKGETCYSPRLVLRHKKAHCFEGALFAAAALYFHGYKPLLMGLKSVRDDDHLLALYKIKGYWGAIGQSKFAGLRLRNPIYRNLRELALSYFENYCNWDAEKTLRRFSKPIDISVFDKKNWMVSEKSLNYINTYTDKFPYEEILPKEMVKYLTKVKPYSFGSGIIIKPHDPKIIAKIKSYK